MRLNPLTGRGLRCVLLLYIGLLLAACGTGPGEQLIEDYLQRLEQAAPMGLPAVDPVTLQRYPGHRERTLALQEIRVGLFGMLDYRRCEMLHLISERNSILGRVMPISQRLLYEVRFLQQAEACHQRLEAVAELHGDDEAEADFRGRLREVIERKRADLAPVFWNATFDSPEMAKAHSLAVSPLVPESDNGLAASLQAVDYFIRLGAILEGAGPAVDLDGATLERQYEILQAEQYSGRLLTTVALLSPVLRQAVAVLTALGDDSARCSNALLAVYHETVRGEFGAYIEQVHHAGRSWLGAMERLLARQRVAPPSSMLDYHARMLSLRHPQGLWQRFERQRLRHDRLWQDLVRRCQQ